MANEEQRLKEKLLAGYSEAVDALLKRCREKRAFYLKAKLSG